MVETSKVWERWKTKQGNSVKCIKYLTPQLSGKPMRSACRISNCVFPSDLIFPLLIHQPLNFFFLCNFSLWLIHLTSLSDLLFAFTAGYFSTFLLSTMVRQSCNNFVFSGSFFFLPFLLHHSSDMSSKSLFPSFSRKLHHPKRFVMY